MKTIVAILSLAAAMCSHAETAQSTVACEDWPTVKQVIEASGERALLRGLSHRGINDQLVQFETIVFVNPENGSFTVVERWADTMFCVVQVGSQMHTYSP